VAKILDSARHPRAAPPYGRGVISIDPTNVRLFLEAIIAAFSILGGGMAALSGFRAADAVAKGLPPKIVAHRINEGIASGYETFSSLSILALGVMLWTG
jgi:hypothetical protein